MTGRSGRGSRSGFDFSAIRGALGYQQFDFTPLVRPAARARPPRVLDSRTGRPFVGLHPDGRPVSPEYKLAAYRRFELERDRLHARFEGPSVTESVSASLERPPVPEGKTCLFW